MLKGFVNINVTEDSLLCSTVSVDFTGFAKTCVAYKQKVRKRGGGRAHPGDSVQEVKVVKKKKVGGSAGGGGVGGQSAVATAGDAREARRQKLSTGAPNPNVARSIGS